MHRRSFLFKKRWSIINKGHCPGRERNDKTDFWRFLYICLIIEVCNVWSDEENECIVATFYLFIAFFKKYQFFRKVTKTYFFKSATTSKSIMMKRKSSKYFCLFFQVAQSISWYKCREHGNIFTCKGFKRMTPGQNYISPIMYVMKTNRYLFIFLLRPTKLSQ